MNILKKRIRKVSNQRRHSFLLFLLIALLLPSSILTDSKKCNREPEGNAPKTPSDGRFRLRIEGNPEAYTPGKEYTVYLAGTRSSRLVHKFIGFFLVVEKASTDSQDFLTSDFGATGTFSLFSDNLSKFSEKCSNAITHTSAIPKGEIKIHWKAPTTDSGCVIFRATVIEHRDIWYMDDEYLNKHFCKDDQDAIETQAILVDPCCACEEAKYELTFERVWSRHTHPKDFPPDSLSTRFSDIIGASHTVNYRFWEYDKMASPGLRQIAEYGSTRDLETELKDNSENIRTIIKARGVTQTSSTGKTFAVFRVDSNHHLISLVSMIDPSPDWIVGVSGLELCNSNCTWAENKTIKLYPWDAGTDSGMTYISPDQPTNPVDVIRRIKPNFPDDQNSPFYDLSGIDMKPMAYLHISRQRIYDKNCEESENNAESNAKACETTQWEEWGECNKKCGTGKQMRNRNYIDAPKANLIGCHEKLYQSRPCVGEEPYCDNQNTNGNDNGRHFIEVDPNNSRPECELGDWEPWSSCSASCGRGHKTRSRKYRGRNAKKCRAGAAYPPVLEETEECIGESCIGDINTPIHTLENQNCKTTKWSRWSPCSVTCGLGVKTRTRRLMRTFYPRRNKRQLRHEQNNDNSDVDDENDEEENVNQLTDNSLDRNDPCADIVLNQTVECGQEQPSCDAEPVPDYCHMEPESGNCRVPATRWFFHSSRNDCILFMYSGCGGNRNRFASHEECIEKCKRFPSYSRLYN